MRRGDLDRASGARFHESPRIRAADAGPDARSLVDSAKSTANQALADKSAVTSGLAATAATVSGSKSFQGLAGTADGTQDFSSMAKDGSLDISLDGGKTKTTIRLDSATLGNNTSDLTKVSATQIVSAINSQISSSSSLKGNVSASVASDGRISFSTTKVGAQQQLSVSGSGSSTLDIGFGKGSSQAGAIVTGTAAMTGGNVTLGANSSTFTVNDGSKSTDITIDSTSLDATGTALGAAATTSDRVKEAIQRKLDEAGFDVTVGNATNTTLTFTSKDVGTGSALTVTGKTSTVDLGFGTTTGTSGTRTVGTGTAASGLSAKGSDATDGSAKALINGTKVLAAATGGPPATAGGLDFSGDNDASFNLQIGDGQLRRRLLSTVTPSCRCLPARNSPAPRTLPIRSIARSLPIPVCPVRSAPRLTRTTSW